MTNTYEKFSVVDRWLITIAVMSATLMQVLDTTIVNVALPHMQGSLNATPDEIAWVLTSYLVSSAIFMPLTGYFSDILGRKNYMLISILGFVVASGLCGAANSITEMVLFRMLQGVFGAALVPLSQAILTEVYPPEERGTAMAIWGVGVMIGPVLGPTLGGYLTEIASWRWNFYINLPVGILSLLIAWQYIPDTTKKIRHMDWLGLILISLAIGATQYVLDRGNHADWFDSNEICFVTGLAIIGLVGFVINSYLQKTKSVFDIRIFKDRNFVIASLLLCIFGLGLFGGTVILPLMLENLFNYPVLTTGLVMSPRGLSAMISMILVGKLIRYIDPRILILSGLICCAFGTWVGTFYNLEINSWWIIWPLLFQGFGLGMIFVPLSTIAFAKLPEQMRAEGAGLFSLVRTIGSSMGISIVITIYTRHAQISWNEIGAFITPYNTAVNQYIKPLGLDISDPTSISILTAEVAKQSQVIGFIDVYAFITWSFIAMIPLLLFIKVYRSKKTIASMAMD